MSPPVPKLSIGQTLAGQYRVERKLGEGGQGDVYLATDLWLDRPVAVKTLRHGVLDRLERDRRFRREARMLSRLSHPNIVTVHAFRTDGETSYLVMEYVDGRSLAHLLGERDHLPPRSCAHIASQMLAALDHAHRRGVVHRDLKPGNVLITAARDGTDDLVKVVDFGLAKTLSAEEEPTPALTSVGVAVGTPVYMAPEQVTSSDVDGRADIYSLGLLFSELLTGKLPFDARGAQGLMMAKLSVAPRLPSELRPDLFAGNRDLDDVIERALRRLPGERWPDAASFSDALLSALGVTDQPRLSGRPAPGQTPTFRVARVGFALQLRIDVPGAETLDPAELGDCLGLLNERTRASVAEHGGQTLGPMVGGFTALFGVDPEEEVAAERAVDAALALRAVVQASGADPRVPPGFAPTVHLGVSTGVLIVGLPDVAHGSPLESARGLARAAAPGELVVDRAVWRHIRGYYEGAAVADGQGWRVDRKRPPAQRLRSTALLGMDVDLIGRDAELRRLTDIWQRVRDTRRAAVAVVSGPAGVGKSRLVAELLERAGAETGASFEVGRSTPGRRGPPYEPFSEVLRLRMRLRDGDDTGRSRQRIAHWVRRELSSAGSDPDLPAAELISALETFLGTGTEGEAPTQLDDRAAGRARLHDTVADILRRRADRGPLIYVLEDFEAATEPTLDLLGHLTVRLADTAVLFVLVQRTTSAGSAPHPWARQPDQVEEIPLAPLDAAGSEALVRHLLRRLPHVPGALVRRIEALAGGVPMVAEETVCELVEAGAIDAGGEVWQLSSRDARPAALPATVQALLLGRVARLPERQRHFVEAAAIAGPRFWPTQVAAMTGARVSFPDLVELVDKRLLTRHGGEQVGGSVAYGFAQLAVMEAVQGALPAARRRTLHRAAATWLVDTLGTATTHHAGAIGRHFLAAGDPRGALPYLLRAADLASSAQALAASIELLLLSREALTGLSSERVDAAVLARIQRQLATQLLEAGRLEEAVDLADAWLAAAQDPVAPVRLVRARALEYLGRYDAAHAEYGAVYGQVVPASLEALQALIGLAGTGAKLGDPALAAAELRDVLGGLDPDSVEPEWDRHLARAHRVVGNTWLWAGDRRAAIASYTLASGLAERAVAPGEEVDTLNGLAAAHYFEGDLDAAQSAWEAARDSADRWDLPRQKALVLNNLGELALQRGAHEAALQHLAAAEALNRFLNARELLCDTRRLQAEAHLAGADPAAAVATAQLAVALARDGLPGYYVGFACRTLAAAFRALGDEERATAAAEESVAAFDAAGMPKEAERSAAAA